LLGRREREKQGKNKKFRSNWIKNQKRRERDFRQIKRIGGGGAQKANSVVSIKYYRGIKK